MTRLKSEWKKFAAHKPGTRFAAAYRERKSEQRSPIARAAFFIAGIVVVAIGIVALPAPGPGMLIIAAGLTLIARESLWIARILDRAEVRARPLMRALKTRFRRARAH